MHVFFFDFWTACADSKSIKRSAEDSQILKLKDLQRLTKPPVL